MAVHAEKLQPSPSTLPPGTEVKGWRILEPLREGGFGATYRVEPAARPGEFFVLKIARERGDEPIGRDVAMRMMRGRHPHVVRVRDCGYWPHASNGYFYFVTEEMPELSLHIWAETRNGSIREAVDKLATVALTLEHLHAEGVLHRDLQPEHIRVRESDGEPMLVHFGLRWYAAAEGLAPRTTGLGAPHLLSPEAVAFLREHGSSPEWGYDYKPTDEVYALGVCAYRVLTGHWPFPPHLPPGELFAAIEDLSPPPPWEVNPKLPRALGEVVQRMMARRVQRRFQSCAEAHAALVAAMSLAGPEALEVSLFAYEPVPGTMRPGQLPQLRVQLPEWPRREWPPRRSWLKALGKRVTWRPRASVHQMGRAVTLAGFFLLAGFIARTLPLPGRAAQPARPAVQKEVLGRELADSTGLACSQEAIGNMRWLQIGTLQLRPLEHVAHQGSLVIEVRDGEKVVWGMLDPWASRVPVGTRFEGRLWVRDRVHGRFERMLLPDGRQLPVCLEFWKSEFVRGSAGQGMSTRLVAGVELAQPSTTPGVGRVDIQAIETEPVRRWGVLKPEGRTTP